MRRPCPLSGIPGKGTSTCVQYKNCCRPIFFFFGGGGGGGSFQFCFVLVFWLIFVKEKHLFLVGGTEISGECYFQLRGFKLISIF